MKIKGRRVFSALLALLLAVLPSAALASFAADAAEEPSLIVERQPCGDRAYYDITSDGLLRVYGEGEMWYATHWEDGVFPWTAEEYNDLITDVTVESGVTRLKYHAFAKMNAMRTLTLGDTVYNYSSSVVYESKALSEINVSPDNQRYTVYNGAMYSKDMTKLLLLPAKFVPENNRFTVPEGVTEIGEGACRNCWNVHLVYFPDSLKTIGDSAFYMCEMITHVFFGENLETIGSGAFQCDARLASVSVPDSVTTLGYGAFKACGSLRTAVLGSGVKQIRRDTFYHCGKLYTVKFTKSVKTIEEGAFLRSDAINEVWYDGGERQFDAIDVGENNGTLLTAERRCTGEDVDPDAPELLLQGVQIGDDVYYDFWSDGSLNVYGSGPAYDREDLFFETQYGVHSGTTEITVQSGVTSLPGKAFLPFSGAWTSISLPDTLVSFDHAGLIYARQLQRFTVDPENPVFSSIDGVLYNKDQTELINYPNMKEGGIFVVPATVKTIGDHAFSHAINLTEVILPDGLERIGESAFCYGSVGSVDFGNTLRRIDDCAFEGCRSLTEVILPDSLGTLGSAVFNGCWLIGSFTFGGGLAEIPYQTLFGCSSLTNVTIPLSVTAIGDGAFEGSWPAEVWYGGSEATWKNITVGMWNQSLLDAAFHYAFECIDPSGHSPVEYPEIQPTCDAHGYTAGVYCEKCDTWLSGHEVIHNTFGHRDVLRQPTTEEEGSVIITCTVCGEQGLYAIEKLAPSEPEPEPAEPDWGLFEPIRKAVNSVVNWILRLIKWLGKK
ncbi:MAG: leucine-rich repeat domain-containing protein [Clostridia bacterium]|nr:leucine-rich repeat domain-containing protein [Clostridia bacterium]